MNTQDSIVRSWKEYTREDRAETSPLQSMDIEESAEYGGFMPGTWDGTYCCCDATWCH